MENLKRPEDDILYTPICCSISGSPEKYMARSRSLTVFWSSNKHFEGFEETVAAVGEIEIKSVSCSKIRKISNGVVDWRKAGEGEVRLDLSELLF
jgi:hypothetical protein